MKYPLVNVGYGQDITIKELATLITEIVGYSGNIFWHSDKPDGTLRKLLDINLIHQLGWQASTPLKKGLEKTYQDFLTRNILKETVSNQEC